MKKFSTFKFKHLRVFEQDEQSQVVETTPQMDMGQEQEMSGPSKFFSKLFEPGS